MSPIDTPLNAASLEGQTLCQRYLINALIGQGGMAWVYKATDLQTQTPVAIKVLREHRRRNPKGEERFLREASTQAQLQHPHIVQVHDLFSEQGITGFVQEWCAGGDLHQFLEQHDGPLSTERLQSLFLPLLDAVAYAHEKGLIHRDIKPANVLLHPESCELVKLNDFGLVKVLELESLTSTGAVMGTVHYMAPEQFEETKAVDHRADIYSLGVLLYEMATGRLPFTGRMPSLGMKIMRNPPPLPREAPAALHALLFRCLAKRPEARFQDCHSLRDAFFSAMSGAVHSATDSAHALDPALAQTAAVVSYDDLQTPDFQDVLSAPESHDAQAEELPHSDVTEDTVALATSDPAPALWSDTTPQEVPVFAMPEAPAQRRPSSMSMGWLGILLLVGFGIGIFGALQWQSLQRTDNRADASAKDPSPTALRAVADAMRPTPLGRPLQSPAARPLGVRVGVAPLRATPRVHAPRMANSRERGPSDAGPRLLPDAPRALELPDLAVMTFKGMEGPRDLEKARQMLIPLCDKGSGVACRNLSYLYRFVLRKAPHRLTLASLYARKGCALHHITSCVAWGHALSTGQGTRRDLKKAFQAFQKACQGNHGTGCFFVANALAKGIGVRKDTIAARRQAHRSCELKDEDGCHILGRMYTMAVGGKRDCTKANRAYRKACQLGEKTACRESCLDKHPTRRSSQ